MFKCHEYWVGFAFLGWISDILSGTLQFGRIDHVLLTDYWLIDYRFFCFWWMNDYLCLNVANIGSISLILGHACDIQSDSLHFDSIDQTLLIDYRLIEYRFVGFWWITDYSCLNVANIRSVSFIWVKLVIFNLVTCCLIQYVRYVLHWLLIDRVSIFLILCE